MSVKVCGEGVDEAVLLRARGGSDGDFQRIVEAHQSMVFSIALNFFRDRTLAEDVAQDVFLRLYRRLPEIQSPSHLIGWLRTVTSNRCIDLQRRGRSTVHEELDQHEAPGDQTDPLLRRTLRRLVGSLTAPQRLVLTLRYQEDLGVEEIAETLEMPPNTVKSHLRRGLLTLREQLAPQSEGGRSSFSVRRISL